jgi:hypothetical protein
MSGHVSGMVLGVSTAIELKARYRYDRHRNRLDWLGMIIKEKREPSPVTDGFDVAARLQVTLLPQNGKSVLSEMDFKGVSFQPTPELLQLEHHASQGGWTMVYDRSWKLIPGTLDKAEMHLFDSGDHLAQCHVSTPPKTDPTKLISLSAYQEELKTALDKDFGEFVKAGESATSANYRQLRVEIRGTVDDLPMRWIYYHLADPHGRQAVFVVVVEEKNIERLAGRDKALIDAFRFTEIPK